MADKMQGIGRLHEEIWKSYNGFVPEGYHIHHKDKNPFNNSIENLECLPASEHLKLHMEDEKHKEQCRKNIQKAIAAAPKWHKSEEGRKWHSEHSKQIWENLQPVIKKCEYCGKEYTTVIYFQRFCSNVCKSAWRRKSRIDDETRTCPICGKEFRVNKYSKKQFCSRSCASKSRQYAYLQPDS